MCPCIVKPHSVRTIYLITRVSHLYPMWCITEVTCHRNTSWQKQGVQSRAARWVCWKGLCVYLLYVVFGSSCFTICVWLLMSDRVPQGVSVVTNPIRNTWRGMRGGHVGSSPVMVQWPWVFVFLDLRHTNPLGRPHLGC